MRSPMRGSIRADDGNPDPIRPADFFAVTLPFVRSVTPAVVGSYDHCGFVAVLRERLNRIPERSQVVINRVGGMEVMIVTPTMAKLISLTHADV